MTGVVPLGLGLLSVPVVPRPVAVATKPSGGVTVTPYVPGGRFVNSYSPSPSVVVVRFTLTPPPVVPVKVSVTPEIPLSTPSS